MNYKLNNEVDKNTSYTKRLFQSAKELGSYLDKKKFVAALLLVVVSSSGAIITPYYLGKGIDQYISNGNLVSLSYLIFALTVLYIVSNTATYFQQNIMGKASQQALYKLRGVIFNKLQTLPIAFFNQNRTGDLISRLNNDTEKLSQFLSESILRFVGSAFTLIGIGIFILYLNFKLALVLLSSTLFLLFITRIISPVLEKSNRKSSESSGAYTSGISEQLTNFKAIIAFDRRNFFEKDLNRLGDDVYKKYMLSDFLNQVFSPLYDFAGYVAQAVVLVYGLFLISSSSISIGLLIAFLGYATRFYDPLRWVASIFGNIQVSLASWGRIQDILKLKSNLEVLDDDKRYSQNEKALLVFDNVSFKYEDSDDVISKVSFVLEKGKTYALVGPTGGGKTTLASLMARLYDPTAGTIIFKSKNIRTFKRPELSESISVILQEPFLFSGTVEENMRYGNDKIKGLDANAFVKLLAEKSMDSLLKRFPDGLQTPIQGSGENISLGQKQLISFVRTVLRSPELLILDEATANIDTVTESALQELVDSLPETTTKVIIAHRLNTIKNADEILFVSGGEVKCVKDEKEVLELLRSVSKS